MRHSSEKPGESMPRSRALFASLFAPLAVLSAVAGARAQGAPCQNEIMPLRQEMEKTGMSVKAAIDRKAERSEICNQVKRFASTEAKFVKYIEDNQSWCGIPPEIVNQVKTQHTNTLGLRQKACAAPPPGAAGRPAVPPGPGLSDALGTSGAVGGSTTAKPGRGTFDTLTGSALAR